ncbi:MAG: methyltransferase domain-containing protein [Chloroflexota bacterium]
MSNEKRVNLFDQWAKTYDQSVHSANEFPFDGYERLLDRIVDLSGHQSGMKVLDLGTGTGNLAERFVPMKASIWGLDFSNDMLVKAREKMPGAHFAQVDLFGAWPDEFEQKFDRIVSSYVFHEFELAEKIDLIQRLAKNNIVPGGYFILGDISFPTKASEQKARELIGNQWDEDEYYWVAEEDIRACEEKGFEVKYEQISSCGGIFIIKPG